MSTSEYGLPDPPQPWQNFFDALNNELLFYERSCDSIDKVISIPTWRLYPAHRLPNGEVNDARAESVGAWGVLRAVSHAIPNSPASQLCIKIPLGEPPETASLSWGEYRSGLVCAKEYVSKELAHEWNKAIAREVEENEREREKQKYELLKVLHVELAHRKDQASSKSYTQDELATFEKSLELDSKGDKCVLLAVAAHFCLGNRECLNHPMYDMKIVSRDDRYFDLMSKLVEAWEAGAIARACWGRGQEVSGQYFKWASFKDWATIEEIFPKTVASVSTEPAPAESRLHMEQNSVSVASDAEYRLTPTCAAKHLEKSTGEKFSASEIDRLIKDGTLDGRKVPVANSKRNRLHEKKFFEFLGRNSGRPIKKKREQGTDIDNIDPDECGLDKDYD